MKKIFLFLLFATISSMIQSQSFEKIRVIEKNGTTYTLENATLNLQNRSINYVDENNKARLLTLSEINKIEERKGSYWATGLVGGFVGSILANAIGGGDEENPWYFGAGPSILGGTGVATLVGSFIPRYKDIDISNNTKLTVSLTSLKILF